MPALIFEHNKALPQEFTKTCMCHEPNNQLVVIGIEQETQKNESTYPELGDYSNLHWEYSPAVLTSQKIKNVSVKSYPRIGGIGFYTLKHEDRSVILAPLFTDEVKYIAPTMEIVITTDITFNIQDPDTASFECYRIVVRDGYFADEYITYEKQLSIPYEDLTGKELYIMGYIDEQLASEARLYTI